MTSSLSSRPIEAASGWRAVLKLIPADPGADRRLEPARAAALRLVIRRAGALHLAGAAIVAMLLRGVVPIAEIGGWVAAIVVLAGVAMAFAGSEHGAARFPLLATLLALCWAVPPAIFAANADLSQQLALCLLTASMMMAAVILLPASPYALIGSVIGGGLGLMVMLAGAGNLAMAAVPLLFVALLLTGGLAASRQELRRRLIEVALARKAEDISLLLREHEDAGADWLWETDAAKRLRAVSTRLAVTLGATPASLEGRPLIDLIGGDAAAPSVELAHLVDLMNARESFADLDLPVVIGGEQRWWRISAAARRDAAGGFAGFRGVGSDITEQHRSAARIDQMARFDGLTGLPNRLELLDTLRARLGTALRGRGRCALLLVDLDKFKAVNDTLGHPVGDRLLKLVAERLRNQLGAADVAGRLGGDEFAVVMADAYDNEMVARLSGNIIAALAQPFEIDGNVIRIGASIGSAIGHKDGRSVELLMRNADLALYRAKADGRGVHRHYDTSLLAAAERRRAIESALRDAIDQGDQFHLVYQPLVDVDSGRVHRFEALLRWTHPTMGVISPGDFLPIAEEARLGARIGEWVLRTACAAAAGWPEEIGVSVNLGVQQLLDRQLPATILSALAQSSLDAGRLEVEVSETVFLRDNKTVVSLLDGLRAIGVRIALDDFGCGLAALGYVKSGRFNAIKIDGAFVRGSVATSPESLAIVRAGVAMASSLGAVAVAEGAETLADLDRMRELGCQHIQGNLAGAPMSADAVRAMLRPQAAGERGRSAA